jgi:HAD superfamily hydrolase (TIGR01509 family)
MSVDVRDTREVRPSLEGTEGVLFDFDGPVCRLFPHNSSLPVAKELRGLVTGAGLESLLVTDEEKRGKDPHAVLLAVHRAMRDGRVRRRTVGDLVGTLEALLSRREVDAAAKAEPTKGAAELIRRLAGRGVRLAVVTNNSARAASAYLESSGLGECFAVVHGRTRDLDRMKPHPDIVHRALASLAGLGVGPERTVMIGDSPADVRAAHGAGVDFIGYGRDETKESKLRAAGATTVLNSYALLLDEA